MGFLQKLRDNEKNTKTETKTETTAEPAKKGPAFLNKAKPVPTGVLPEDAPSRETPVAAAPAASEETEAEVEETAAEAAEAPKRRGRPPGSKNGRKSNGTAAVNGHTGFVLYIDAWPQKGVEIEPTLFEDWCSGIITDLNNELEKEKGIASFWMLSFAEQKYAIETKMASRLGNLPPAMIMSSRAPHANEAMAVLVPNAAIVVRGF